MAGRSVSSTNDSSLFTCSLTPSIRLSTWLAPTNPNSSELGQVFCSTLTDICVMAVDIVSSFYPVVPSVWTEVSSRATVCCSSRWPVSILPRDLPRTFFEVISRIASETFSLRRPTLDDMFHGMPVPRGVHVRPVSRAPGLRRVYRSPPSRGGLHVSCLW